jgi:hypothetical protein
MDFCRKDLWSQSLLHPDGKYTGNFFFPFGHFAVLSNITRKQLATLDPLWVTLFPPDRVITKDELDAWQGAANGNLLKILARYIDPSRPFPALTGDHINILSAIIHPEILISIPSLNIIEMDCPTRPTAASERVREEPPVLSAHYQSAAMAGERCAHSSGRFFCRSWLRSFSLLRFGNVKRKRLVKNCCLTLK